MKIPRTWNVCKFEAPNGKHYRFGWRLTGETRRVPGAINFVMEGKLLDPLPLRAGMVTWPTRHRRHRR